MKINWERKNTVPYLRPSNSVSKSYVLNQQQKHMQPKTTNSIVLSVPFRFAHSCVTQIKWSRVTLGRCLLNTKDSAPGLDHAEKLDLCKGYGNPRRKIGVAKYFFEIINLESQQKCSHQHFSEKGRKGYFFADYLRILIYMLKSKHVYTIGL